MLFTDFIILFMFGYLSKFVIMTDIMTNNFRKKENRHDRGRAQVKLGLRVGVTKLEHVFIIPKLSRGGFRESLRLVLYLK